MIRDVEEEVRYRGGMQVVRGENRGVCNQQAGGPGCTKERQIVGSDKKEKLTRRQMTEAKRKLFKESCTGRRWKIWLMLSGICFMSITLLLQALKVFFIFFCPAE